MNTYMNTFEINENTLRVVLSADKDVKEPYLVKEQPVFNGICTVGTDNGKEESKIIGNGRDLFVQKNSSFVKKDVNRFTFEGGKPIVVTKKTVDGERSFVENANEVKIGEAYEAKVVFEIEPDEAIYGLGQHEDGVLNYRNTTEYLYHNNMKIPMPVFISSKNYAVFFDCSSMMIYEEKDNKITVTCDAVDQIDYYVICGNCFDDLIAGIRTLTGAAVMLPKWAFGYIQSKERYKTQEEILSVADEFKKRDIPLGCIVLDWLSWEDGKWGNMHFDKSRFPDARKMVDELHSKGVAFMISVWPNRKEGCEDHKEFEAAGKLLCNYSNYDAFDEEARDIYWKQCERELFPAGTDAWWCDSSEPFTPDWNGEKKRPEDVRYEMAKESTNKYLDARISAAHPLWHAKGIYDHQRAACDTKRVCNLTRAGYPGIQQYGTILWSGDIAATWEVYRHQIAEGLSMSMSGMPYWTLDAGGFFVGNTESWKRWANVKEGTRPWFWHGSFENGVADLGYRELYTRWLQLAAFLPIMRSHGTDTPREPWQFGEKGTVYYDTIVKYINLRYELMPYTYSLAAQVAMSGYTMMRSLMFDFENDDNVKDMWQEYMYGPAFLVAPVLEAYEYGPDSTPLNKSSEVEVYLPNGAKWYDYETKQLYEGGQKIKTDAPISKMPLFVRSGAIIPKASKVNGEADTIEVYSGQDGMFVLYLDNGKDYAYEKGEMTTIPVIWSEEQQALMIGKAVGNYSYPEKFHVVLYKEDGTVLSQDIIYKGEDTLVR